MDKVNFSQMKQDAILVKLEGISKQIVELQQMRNDKVFLDTEELCIAMNISKRTAQVWRSKNVIAFSKIGRKYYYKLSDIKALLDKNYVPAKPHAK